MEREVPNTQMEAHEERIQRTEDNVQELAVGLATNTTKLEALEKTVHEGFEAVNVKLDSYMTTGNVVAKEVASLARSEAQRVVRMGAFTKLLWIVISAAGGIMAEKLIAALHLLSK